MDLAQLLVSHGHPPETVGGYAICTIEAFAESIMHLEALDERRKVIGVNVAAQGDSKCVKDYLKAIKVAKKSDSDSDDGDSEEVLREFQTGRLKGAR